MNEEHILVTDQKEHIGTLVFNRPGRRNALSPELLAKVHLTLREWAAEDNVRAVVITGGAGNIFSSGYDIAAIPTDLTPEIAQILKNSNPLELALNGVRNYPYPTIAMIGGDVFGAGLNLAMCCDIRIGVDTMRAGMPPSRLGLVYHPEGIRQFVEVLGMARAREVFFAARNYRGQDALAMGLVDHIVPAAQLESVTYELARDIASRAPLSLKGMKRIFNIFGDAVVLSDEQVAEAERLIMEAFNSDDLKEGQTAFFEKRKPKFTGR